MAAEQEELLNDDSWSNDVDGLLSSNDSYGMSGNYSYRLMTFEEYFLASQEYTCWKNLKTYARPGVILFGSIGNLLAFIALTRRHMQHNSVCFYFAVLCIMDTVVLYVGCGLDWLSFVSGTPHLANLTDSVCRIWEFVFKVLLSMPSWLVVSSLIDRFLVMWHPIKAQSLCTVFMAKVVTVMIVVALVVISIHAMWTMTLDPEVEYCRVDPEMLDFQRVVWPMIEASLNNYLPMLLVIAFTLILIAGCVYPHGRGDSEYQQMRLTRATISIGLMYIVLELPTLVVNLMVYYEYFTPMTFQRQSQLLIIQEICPILRCLNEAVLFLLLFLCLPMLRYEIWTLLQRFKPPTANGTAGDRELQGVPPTGEQLLPPTTSIEVSSDVTLL